MNAYNPSVLINDPQPWFTLADTSMVDYVDNVYSMNREGFFGVHNMSNKAKTKIMLSIAAIIYLVYILYK